MTKLTEIMTRDVAIVDPNADLFEVAKKMKQEDAGVLPVCDGRKLQGMITDRDVVIRGLAANKDPRETRASDIMTKDVYYCYEKDDVQDAADKMQEQQIRRLVVVDENKNLVGIISIGDMAARTRKKNLVGKTLGEIVSQNGVLSRTGIKRSSIILGLLATVVGLALFKRRMKVRAPFQKVVPTDKNGKKDLIEVA